ncbi:MAG: hypothetical protein ACRDFS_00300 [Chloroflexota bacterium]
MSDEEEIQPGGPEGMTDDVTGAEADGNPTVSGMRSGGEGTDVGDGSPEAGGARGSGGGVVDRVGGMRTVGGVSSGTLGGSSVGSGMPPEPPPIDEDEE